MSSSRMVNCGYDLSDIGNMDVFAPNIMSTTDGSWSSSQEDSMSNDHYQNQNSIMSSPRMENCGYDLSDIGDMDVFAPNIMSTRDGSWSSSQEDSCQMIITRIRIR